MFEMSDLRRLKDVEKDDVLRVLGLEERRSTPERLLQGLGLLAAGALVGAGVALFVGRRPERLSGSTGLQPLPHRPVASMPPVKPNGHPLPTL